MRWSGTWLRLSDTGQVVESGLSYLGASLCFTWLVGRAAHGFGGWAGAALAWGPVRYLGKISYGAYVAHWFLMWILPLLFTQAGQSPPAGPWGQFLLLQSRLGSDTTGSPLRCTSPAGDPTRATTQSSRNRSRPAGSAAGSPGC